MYLYLKPVRVPLHHRALLPPPIRDLPDGQVNGQWSNFSDKNLFFMLVNFTIELTGRNVCGSKHLLFTREKVKIDGPCKLLIRRLKNELLAEHFLKSGNSRAQPHYIRTVLIDPI